MKFLELNKKRHATKHFTDKPVDPKMWRTAIEIATLAPRPQQLALEICGRSGEKCRTSKIWHTVQTLNRYHQHL